MRSLIDIRKAFISSVFAFAVLAGGALVAEAQNVNAEYRQWQNAQAKAQREHAKYLRTRRANDYRKWQDALRKAEKERQDYLQALNRSRDPRFGDRYGDRRYRVVRGGNYYYTDSRGAELLRQAVRSGYEQGYRQGMLDRQYGRRYNYGGVTMYRTATYGYQSYVDRSQYQYYFQQGFQRGYEDGFYTRTTYGTRAGNTFNILGSVLNTILNIVDDPN